MADINLTKAVRSNLLSLQSTAAQMSKTQERLATGLKVNSALDNPTNFFTASSLNSRASDMGNLLDSMSNGISTIEAADNGLKSITKTVESMQSTLRQARQDKSFKTASYTVDSSLTSGTLTFTGGAFTSAQSVSLAGTDAAASSNATSSSTSFTFGGPQTFDVDDALSFTIAVDGGAAKAVTINRAVVQGVGNGDDTIDDIDELQSAISAAFATAGVTGVTLSNDGTDLTITSNLKGATSDIQIAATAVSDVNTSGFANTTGIANADAANGSASGGAAAYTVDELVNKINNDSNLNTAIRASNDNGKLRIENLSTQTLNIDGVTSSGKLDGTTSGAANIGGNEVRKSLVEQFNNLRDQLDKFADDASFNGINLLRGDKLKLTFNETGTSTIEIQAKKSDGSATSINNTELGITLAEEAHFDNDTTLDARLDVLSDALGTLRSHASNFGSNLSIVENRQDFTKNMINTLETGAANLTLADTNEEAANLLALQTRQQLSSTALSMASQADQAVLRLF